nr:MAG TPA: hypothetical protein [Caudoviricetes sp.]
MVRWLQITMSFLKINIENIRLNGADDVYTILQVIKCASKHY